MDLKGWFNEEHVNMTGGVYPGDNYYLMTQWTPGILDFGMYSADTTIHYGRDNQNNTLTTHNEIFVFPLWLIILALLILLIYILKKKEVSSPVTINIERKNK